jgi:hypothetical protein
MLKAAFSQMGVRACVCVYVCSGSTCAGGIAHAQSAETVDGNITPVRLLDDHQSAAHILSAGKVHETLG